MDSLEGLWKKFSLSDFEGDGVDLTSETDQPKSYLAAKFLTRRSLNVEAVARTFKPLWRTDKSFTIRDMSDNIVVIVFDDEADRERVLQGEPWTYDKHLIVFQRITEEEAIEEVNFNEISFWIQLHGLLVRKMNQEAATLLAAPLGVIEQVAEGDSAIGNGQCLRIRVRLDISKPLCRGRKARFEKGRETWVSFKYERLPNFCYWCGCVTHSEKDCSFWLCNKNSLRVEDQQFGPWMRAPMERPWRKVEVKVEGIARPIRKKQAEPSPTTGPKPPVTVVNLGTAPIDRGTMHMDIEENPGLPSMGGTSQLRDEGDFEQQLRDIDAALNYSPQHPPIIAAFPGVANPIPVPTTLPCRDTLHDHTTCPRVPLGDISNGVAPQQNSPILKSGTKTWKKLARAKGDSATSVTRPTPSKRTSWVLDEDMEINGEQKKHRGNSMDIISAEAVGAMNCLFWNYRGLGNPCTVQELARLVRAQDPTVVFLIETWQDEGPLERLRCYLHFDNKFVVKSRNKGGGLCLFWQGLVNARIQSFSESHIDVIINETLSDAWRLTGFYGAPETQRRDESWDLLRRLKAQSTLPWVCMGDFNEILKADEKFGRLGRSESQMQGFRNVVDDCGFMDLGFTGPRFMWTNNRPRDMTWERLDRVLATTDWILLFPSVRVHHLDGKFSPQTSMVWDGTDFPTFQEGVQIRGNMDVGKGV